MGSRRCKIETPKHQLAMVLFERGVFDMHFLVLSQTGEVGIEPIAAAGRCYSSALARPSL